MAPSLHPSCTPSASCQPLRCHPSAPPCQRPEACLRKTISKGVRPCQSAVSIMATRSKASCGHCSKKPGDPRSVRGVQKYLNQKSKEKKMRKEDRLKGTNTYERYKRKQGTKKAEQDCCAGHGHRGRLRRPYRCCRCCTCCKCCECTII